MICIFLDGPIAGDVRADMPPNFDGTWRVPIPARETWCYCDESAGPTVDELGPEIVEYRAITWGPRVAVMSSEPDADDDELLKHLTTWLVSDLGNPKWVRECRDRRAYR